MQDTTAVWDGCSGPGLFFTGPGTNATARGCHLKTFILSDKATGTLANSIMKEKMDLRVHRGAKGTITGNFIAQYPYLAVKGKGSTARVTGNYFKNNGAALRVWDGARVFFEKNTVDYSFGYPPHALLVGARNEECFGVSVSGAGSEAICKGNHLSSSNDGRPFSEKSGGKITDGGGNTINME